MVFGLVREWYWKVTRLRDRMGTRMDALESKREKLQAELDAEQEKNARLDGLEKKKEEVKLLRKKLFDAKYGKKVRALAKGAKKVANFLEKTGKKESRRQTVVPKDDFAALFQFSGRPKSGKQGQRKGKPYGFEW